MSAETIKRIFDKCLKDHPGIQMYDGILGGTPHLKDARLGVGCILGKIHTYGGIHELLMERADLTGSQVKEAIAFAQDFIELAGLAAVSEESFEAAMVEEQQA